MPVNNIFRLLQISRSPMLKECATTDATILFRGDARAPKEVFETGFNPQRKPNLRMAMRLDRHLRCYSGVSGRPRGIDFKFGVCASTRFESASLFPILPQAENTLVTSYVYIIASPNLSKVEVKRVNDDSSDFFGNQVLIHDMRPMPKENTEHAVDFHSVQMQQISPEDTNSRNVYKAAWPLYAYETVVMYVPTERIAGAVELKQYPCDNFHELENAWWRTCIIERVIPNPDFEPEGFTVAYETEENSETSSSVTYSVKNAQNTLRYWETKIGERFVTTHPSWGLGGKVLPNPDGCLTSKPYSKAT